MIKIKPLEKARHFRKNEYYEYKGVTDKAGGLSGRPT